MVIVMEKPKEADFIKLGKIKVLKYPLKDAEGNIITIVQSESSIGTRGYDSKRSRQIALRECKTEELLEEIRRRMK